MPEKQLTESAWKVFAKGKTYKDDALLKALLALAKSEKSDPADQLEALDAVEKQVEILRKANKADKALSSQLDDMDSALSRQRKAAELAVKTLAQAQAKEKSQAKAEQGGEEDDDTPALLTAKLIPLLRELRKGEVRMHAMVCTSGKNTAVLIMRRPIAVTKRKLLADAADAKGGAKYAVGECVYEEGMLTFIMQSGAKGLAKRIRMALLEQTKMRLKVRVRGDDGEDEDAELEEGEVEGEENEGNADTQSEGAIPPAPPMQPSAAEQTYTKRLELLKKRIAQALQAQHPEAAKIRTLLGFAKDKAEQQKDFVAAGKSLDVLEKLLDATPPVAPPSGGNTTGNDQTLAGDEAQAKAQTAAFTARLTALMPAVKDAVAQAHPEAAIIRAKVAQAGTAARQRDFSAAGALLDDAERLLSSNASAQPEAQQNTQPTQPNPQPELSEQDVRERVNSLGLQLRDLAKHPDFDRLRARFTAAANALRSKDLAQATVLLDEIEPDITKALSQARGQGTAEGPSLRQMAQAALAWRQACAIATAEIATLQAGVIAELEAEDELSADEIDAVRTELDRLNGVLTTISPQLGDLIDTAVNLTADKRAPVLVKLMDMAERAQDDIGSSQMIEAARNNGVHDVDLAAPALAALNTLREAIGPLLAA